MDSTTRNGSQECDVHPGVTAVETCRICGKPVCARCCVRTPLGAFCEQPSHQSMLEHATLLLTLGADFEADMVAKNLEVQGIPSTVFSTRAFKLRLGDDVADEVRIFVRKEDTELAWNALKNLDLPVDSPMGHHLDSKG